MHITLTRSILLLLVCWISSCNTKKTQPKPNAKLALQYPIAQYEPMIASPCSYRFEVNEFARVLSARDCAMRIEYPFMKATMYLNYFEVQGNIDSLLVDGQKLSYKHNIKADAIIEYPFLSPEQKAYGMMYEVEGNAASNAQFYVTDSTKHFLTGALYFYTKPNYDSIAPAVEYVKKDMVKLLETLAWQDK